MPIRNPLYLDQDLLLNVADYHGIAYGVETQIKEKGSTSLTGEGSVGFRGLGAKGGGSKGTELETSYSLPANPLRIMNDVIDEAQIEGYLSAVEADMAGLRKGNLVELDGAMELSAASQVGNLMGRLLPAFAANGGGDLQDDVKTKLIADMVGSSPVVSRQLFSLELELDLGVAVFVTVDPGHFFRNSTFEDLERDVTIFGSVERVVLLGAEVSTERWILPDMDRALRRMFKKQGLSTMLGGLEGMLSVDTEEAQRIKGPAIELRPIAIY
ncbi:hypothetical protein [Pseudarthrobacter sp. MEB009]|uniref:DUF6414 family protein n=1 Tax=Pseudarthrobacter sp. MEB009 TaxID=3040326 RepID=UPI00255282AA|nr:hypothetical protein [Pseudarthrobacter sp. MEB009]